MWIDNIASSLPKIVILRFTRVVFGITSSPFLLNATLQLHLKKYEMEDPSFVNKFMHSIYVDDVAFGGDSTNEVFELYLKTKSRLAEGGFNLRKFVSNDRGLQEKIERQEGLREMFTQGCTVAQDDNSFAKTSLSYQSDVNLGEQRVLGICWNPVEDKLQFEVKEIAQLAKQVNPTKRTIVSIAAKFYDPLGIISPIVAKFKLIVQELCKMKIQTVSGYSIRLVSSKTRVAPVGEQTIPRLELLAALLLAKMISSVHHTLETQLTLQAPLCFTDSTVALGWIRSQNKDWKQFVQNRVNSIRKLVAAEYWRHCPGTENPADIPSRGLDLSNDTRLQLWLHGPRLCHYDHYTENVHIPIPVECLSEMKAADKAVHSLLTKSIGCTPMLNCEGFSNLQKLLRVTAYVLKFIELLKSHSDCVQKPSLKLNVDDISKAEAYWIKFAQVALEEDRRFSTWKQQFNLVLDENRIWRCKGRLANANITDSAKYPILLDSSHHLTYLIVQRCHERVFHNGTKETLTELRGRFWIVKGRQVVRRILRRCVLCKRFEGKPYDEPPPPPLPVFRVQEAPPFAVTGVDYAGPLYLKDSNKVWICLFTCCVIRAVHLEVVPDMTAETFIRCFKRFIARRGIPHKIISDNGKTFKLANKIISAVLSHPQTEQYLSNIRVDWVFNLERAPWWGGIFERMEGDEGPPLPAPLKEGDERPPPLPAPLKEGDDGPPPLPAPLKEGDDGPPPLPAPLKEGDEGPPTLPAPLKGRDDGPPPLPAPLKEGDDRPPPLPAPLKEGDDGSPVTIYTQCGPSTDDRNMGMVIGCGYHHGLTTS
ncbi:hypothetical protein EMCRGX_G012286 [Ephydatia muelleri]